MEPDGGLESLGWLAKLMSAFDTYFLPVPFVGRGGRVRLLESCGGSLLGEEVGERLTLKWKPHSSSFEWETVISLGLLNSTSSLMPGGILSLHKLYFS